ncbi:hypothetical protein D3C83_63250 [compost metagenome]
MSYRPHSIAPLAKIWIGLIFLGMNMIFLGWMATAMPTQVMAFSEQLGFFYLLVLLCYGIGLYFKLLFIRSDD